MPGAAAETGLGMMSREVYQDWHAEGGAKAGLAGLAATPVTLSAIVYRTMRVIGCLAPAVVVPAR